MSSEEIDVVGSMELDANDWPDAQELTAVQDESNERNEESDADINVGSQEAVANEEARVEVAKSRKKKPLNRSHGHKAKRVGQDWQLNKMLSKAKAEAKADAEAAEFDIPDIQPFDDIEDAPNQNVETKVNVDDKIKPDVELPDQSKI